MRTFLIVIGFTIFWHNVASQDLAFQKYDIKDGLAGNFVYHTVQDKDGFLWFATETGVSRYDGKNFQNFTTSNGLPDNDIIKLYVDSKNRVWMMPFNNSICYYLNGKLYTKDNSPLLNRIKLKKNINKIVEDKRGNLFLVEPDAVIVIDKFEKVSRIDQISNQKLRNVRVGFMRKDGVQTFFSSNYFESFGNLNYTEFDISNGGAFTKISYKGPLNFLFNPSIFETYNGKIFAINRNYKSKSRVIVLNSTTNHLKYFFVNSVINTINFVNDSLIYLNTKNGSILYNFVFGSIVSIDFSNESISSTFTDFDGNIWMSTLGNGVYKLPKEKIRTVSFRSKSNAQNQIFSLCEFNGNVLAGSGEQLVYLLNDKQKVTKKIRISKGQTGKIIGIEHDQDVFCLGEYGIFLTSNQLNKITSIKGVTDFPPAFKDFKKGGKNTWYLAASSGIFRVYNNKINLDKPLFNERATTLAVTDSGIFIGTLTGLYFKNLLNNSVKYLGKLDKDLASRITLCYAKDGLLYVGTNDRGLLCFDGRKVVHKYNVRNGLSSNLVRCIFKSKSSIWVGTDKGLNKISIVDDNIKRFSLANGLSSDMINSVLVSDKIVYVGTSSGLSYFNEDIIQKRPFISLKLIGLFASGKEKSFEKQPIILAPKENNIRLEYSGIQLSDGGINVYKYRIAEIGSKWKTTTSNFIDFPELPAGKFTISIVALNNDRVASKVVNISIQIQKRFIEQTWVRIVFFSIILIGIIFISFFQSRKLKRKQLVEFQTANKILELEQMALKSQMNPHFIFNCLNSIQQYVFEKDSRGANKFITSFAKLIRQTLENSGKETISLAEEIEFLKNYLYLEQIRFEGSFNFKFEINSELDTHNTFIPPMLLQPFVENCIRHGIRLKNGNDGLIVVKVFQNNQYIIFLISDNGVGRKIAEEKKQFDFIQYQSKGVSITNQRIAAMNKSSYETIEIIYEDLVSNDGQPQGTSVFIKFPKSFCN